MSFSEPNQFFWLVPIALLLWILWRQRRVRTDQVTRLIERDLIEKVFSLQVWKRLTFIKIFLYAAGLVFLILSLSGPRIGQKLEELKSKGSAVYILFDCSKSMLAEDLKPTRLEKSKLILTGLLEKLHGDRVGVIAFSGEAFVFCPVTFDLLTVKQFLKSVEAGMVPQPGTKMGAAVRLAVSKMEGIRGSKAIVLLTDGEDHKSDPLEAAQEAREAGIRIFSIGIGSVEGEPIPVKDGGGQITGYKKDKKGEVILSRLDESTLAEMAYVTEGSYFRASPSEQEIDFLAQKLEELEKEPLFKKRRLYQDRYQWFAASALLFLLAGEFLGWMRRTAIFLIFIFTGVFGFFSSGSGLLHAESFRGKIKEGNQYYKEGKYKEALESYREAQEIKPKDSRGTFNAGVAHYQLENWGDAKEEFKKGSLSKQKKIAAQSLYNLGNSQFRNGQYKEAVQSFRQSLKLNPKDPDAKHNLRLALKFREKPPPQTKESRSDQKNDSGGDKQKKARAEQEKKAKEENAKRILKGASDEEKNRPLFNPDPDEKDKKKYEEDW